MLDFEGAHAGLGRFVSEPEMKGKPFREKGRAQPTLSPIVPAFAEAERLLAA
jgi:hypothetical protein